MTRTSPPLYAGVVADSSELAELASRVIDDRNVETLFQPLVHLPTGGVVGFEALTRGPRGTPLESPLALLESAEAAGRLAELDWLCAASACTAAQQSDLHPSLSIFLNFEPATLLTSCPEDLLPTIRRAKDRLRVFAEMKERSLLEDPGRVFAGLVHAREIGWGVAIDNAIASPESLGLFPLIRPDVLKLDLDGARSDVELAGSMSDSARLYSAQTGTTILAQGIERGDDLQLALATGASFGQGWLFGKPGPLPETAPIPRDVVPLRARPAPGPAAPPFDLVEQRLGTSIAEQRFLEPIADCLTRQAAGSGPPALLLLSFEHRRGLEDSAAARLDAVTGRAAFTVLVGPAVQEHPRRLRRPNRGHDRLADDWNVVVLGPHYAAALVARDLRDDAPLARRRFRYAITYDRELVLVVAQSFLQSGVNTRVERGSNTAR